MSVIGKGLFGRWDSHKSRHWQHAKFGHHVAKPRNDPYPPSRPGLDAMSATGLPANTAPKSSPGDGRDAQHSMFSIKGVTKPLYSGVASIIP